MNSKVPVLAIDGPSGSGKGTVGQILAQRLGWHFLDSGALYRALGVAAIRERVSLDDKPTLARLATSMDIHFVPRTDGGAAAVLRGGSQGNSRLEGAALLSSLRCPAAKSRDH